MAGRRHNFTGTGLTVIVMITSLEKKRAEPGAPQSRPRRGRGGNCDGSFVSFRQQCMHDCSRKIMHCCRKLTIDGTKFCRSCGTNVSLVPQALAGQLPAPTGEGQEWRPGRRHRSRQPAIDRGFVTTFFTGIAFLIATYIVSFRIPSGIFWGWSLLIPALACLGEAVGGYLKFRDQRRQEQIPAPQYTPPSHQPNPPLLEISAPTTSELIPPTSITEDTTKRLEASR